MKVATRRQFLAAAGTAAALTALPRGLQAQGAATRAGTLAADPMRPQFHLLPAKNWMNDPNGPIYFQGQYHMFFQYNPEAAVWGNMSWNHAVSSDMLHWSHLPVALTPTPAGPDAYGVFSGSAIQVGSRVYAVYTGTKKGSPELATIRDKKSEIQESQCLAWSDDPRLVLWTKDPAPIVPRPPEGLRITGFRDPSAWKQGDWYYMTVGSGIAQVGGCVLLYRSKDMRTWEYLHVLVQGAWNGQPTTNPCEDGEMWECPEFFALDGGHVLIYSTLGKVFWVSGILNEATMKFKAARTGLLDLESFYAPKTQLDAAGRRILWGWIQERRSEDAMRTAGWSGMMSLPRVLNLDKDGTLRMQVLPETRALRSAAVPVTKADTGLRAVLPRATGEVLCTGAGATDFTFGLQTSAGDLFRVQYHRDKHAFVADGKEIALAPADLPVLHAFVDGSVVELIVAGRLGYTRRFYYADITAPDVTAWTDGSGTSLQAWQVSPISSNRLTTPA
ncbi:glycoside hydrolase family 32 protein [Acidipila sp. EB88]|uniref:glycoside hydrolase family 32 protein n=1 Tax=Acidipila sp. EB88 TaxID=2305226 RepID=UPI000F5F6EA2|nr:glycoside hydrolase family 32 protein [Acidipila sp. EB88]RRA49574.1 glycoside hydrolase family 32 protein [Acidipila sp. EB88]